MKLTTNDKDRIIANNKSVILIILFIFCVGMIMGAGDVAASKTFKYGKYKGKISNKEYKKLKTAKKQHKDKSVIVKTGKYKTVSYYKNKEVAKYDTVPYLEYYDHQYYEGWDIVKEVDSDNYRIKKVDTKKVKVVKKYPVKMRIMTIAHSGQYGRGDYVELWVGGECWNTKRIVL